MSMKYRCMWCREDLDSGDIYEHFLRTEGDEEKALRAARAHGWTESNKLHFTKVIIVQPDREPQYEECPKCNKKWPIPKIETPLSLYDCFGEHDGWRTIWKDEEGGYKMYCFACDKFRDLTPKDPPVGGKT